MSSFAGKSWHGARDRTTIHRKQHKRSELAIRSFTFDMTLDKNGRTSFKRTSLGGGTQSLLRLPSEIGIHLHDSYSAIGWRLVVRSLGLSPPEECSRSKMHLVCRLRGGSCNRAT